MDKILTKDLEMGRRKPEIAKQSLTGKAIQQASGWNEAVLSSLMKLRNQAMTGDAHDLLLDAILSAKNTQDWLDDTGVTEKQLEFIESRKLEVRHG